MRKKPNKTLFVITTIVIVISILIAGVRFILLNQRIKNTNISINSELFELCDYLYDTHNYDAIYDIYSLFFKNEKAFVILEELGFDENERTRYITQWGAKYLIASSNVNQKKDAIEDFSCFLSEINKQNSNLISGFTETLAMEISNNNGMLTNLFESLKLKRFLVVLGEAVETTNMPLPIKQQYYDFINGQYASIGDIKSAHIFSWKANGINSQEITQNAGEFDSWGYIFRCVVVLVCASFIVLSIMFIKKRKKILISLISLFLGIVILMFSFLSFDINTPDIDTSFEKSIRVIEKQYLPADNVYNVFIFNCDKYYGTVSISLEDEKSKQVEISKNNFAQKTIDGENATLCSYVACVRDNYTLPNCVVGTSVIYNKNIRIAIKYTYKNQNKFGLVKYLIFSEYFSKPTIDLEEIIECIDEKSLSTIQK